MMTPAQIVRSLGIAGLIGWLAMVGWLAKTTRAQNGNPAAPVVAPAPDSPVAPLSLPTPSSRAEKSKLPPPPPLRAELPSATPDPQIPQISEPPAAAGIVHAEDSQALTADDPEKAVQSFVDRNQKVAESQLKALTAEADQLRARLIKLDAGIKRWQVLVDALKRSQEVSAAVASESSLEPISAVPATQATLESAGSRPAAASVEVPAARHREAVAPAGAPANAPGSTSPR